MHDEAISILYILYGQASRPATLKNRTFPIPIEIEQNEIYTFSNMAISGQNELSVERLERETYLLGFNGLVSHTISKRAQGRAVHIYNIRFKQHKN